MKTFAGTIILTLLIASVSFAQSAKDREVIKQANKEELKKLEQKFQEQHKKDSLNVEEYLKAHPKAKKTFVRNGQTYQLIRIDKNGKPVYIKTKKK